MSNTTTIKTYFQIRRGKASEWASINPILRAGEPGYELDLGGLKIGDGVKTWLELNYIGESDYKFSPDGNSLVVSQEGKLTLYGFDEAEINQIPIKNADGQISWVSFDSNSLTGYIDDLKQRNSIIINGGNALETEELNEGQFNSVIRLRRDNDYNYDKIKNTFIPAKGEICLIDTARNGLRAVCGDGSSTFGELKFLDDFIKKGYYYNGIFYKDSSYSSEIENFTTCLYVDLKTNQLYYSTGDSYKKIEANLEIASEEIAGIMKLYSTLGENIDGTMTQKAITDELNEKVEMAVDAEEELLILSYDL